MRKGRPWAPLRGTAWPVGACYEDFFSVFSILAAFLALWMLMLLARNGSWVPEAYFAVTFWPSASLPPVTLVCSSQVKFLAPSLVVTVKVLSASLTLLVSPVADT